LWRDDFGYFDGSPIKDAEMYRKPLKGLAVTFLLLIGSKTGAQNTQANKPVLRPKATLRNTPPVSASTQATNGAQDLWVSIFPVGTSISGLWHDAADPKTVYAATHHGFFKTTNGGMYWSCIFLQNMEFLTFSQAQSSPSVMYLGGTLSGQGQVWRSEDRGLTWHVVGSGILGGAVRQIAVDPRNPLIAYVISGGELVKTVNGGRTWGNVTPHVSFQDIKIGEPVGFIAVDPGIPNHLLAGCDRGYSKISDVVESMDGGASWKVRDFGRPSQSFKEHGYEDAETHMWAGLIYLGHSGEILGGLNYPVGNHYTHIPAPVVSTDGGRSWKFIREGMNEDVTRASWSYSFVLSEQSGGAIYLATLLGLLRSLDGGTTWEKVLRENIEDVTAGGPNEIYAATGRGLFKSCDGGANWHQATLGLPIEAAVTDSIAMSLAERPFEAFDEGFRTTVRKLAWVDAARKIIYVGDRAGYWTSSTGGVTWSWHSVQTDDGENVRQVVVSGDGTVYLNGVAQGAFATGGSEIIKIDASGKASKVRIDKSPRLFALSPADPQVLYLTAREAQDAAWAFSPTAGTILLKSDDGGFSWAAIDLMRWLPASLRTYRIAALPVVAVSPESSKTLYVVLDVFQIGIGGKHETALLATTDGGSTWQDVSPALQAAMRKAKPSGTIDQIVSLVVDGNDPRVVYLATTGGIFRSGDGGKGWTSLAVGAWQGKITDIAVRPSSSGHLYVAAEPGIWSSRDSGKTWVSLNRGLWGDRIEKLVISGSFVLAQGYNGIYRLSDSSLTWAAPEWQRLEKGGHLSKTWSVPESASVSAPLPSAAPQPTRPSTSSPQPGPPPPAQPAPIGAQPQPSSATPVAAVKRFYVRHRHRGIPRGGGFNVITTYCEGWLIVIPNGTVAYACTKPDTTLNRCERGRFPPIKKVELYEGGLRISLVQGGNWDFFGTPSDIQSAYAAILPYTEEGRKLAH
jgi:photosystem II stability/assembly factor-like uncharacterized protein